MASLARREGKNRWTIQFILDGKRKTIRIEANKRSAESCKRHIEALVASKITGVTVEDETSRWLAERPAEMLRKLVRAGLIDQSPEAAAPIQMSLEHFVTDYCEERSHDCESSTVRKIRSSLNQLVGFLGDLPVGEISPPDAYRYQLERRKTCAQASVSKDIKIAKTAFKHAEKLGLVSFNPFEQLTAGTDVNPAGAHYVDLADFENIMAACPDSTWRVIVCLARIGGLRMPSELRNLKWSDINIETEKMLVTAPKTKRQRRVKLFPWLLTALEDHREIAGAECEYVISRPQYRSKEANLRTQLAKILARAGIPSFPRPFDNFRASASTDLATVYPMKTAADWLGHSVQTALKYYHMSRDRELGPSELATIQTAFGKLGDGALHEALQQVPAAACTEPQSNLRETQKTPENKGFCSAVQPDAELRILRKVTPTGLEPVLPA